MIDLQFWTTLVNLTALAIALWLGFYVVTRSPRSLISWLAAVTLWLLSGYFFHNALAVNLPLQGVFTWLRQTVILVLPVWYHLTALLSTTSSRAPGESRRLALNRIGVPFAYLYAFTLIGLGLSSHLVLVQVETNSALYTNNRQPGPLYPLFILFVAIGFFPTFWNLWRARALATNSNLKQRYVPLMLATILAALGGLWFGLGTQLDLALPSVVGDLLLGCGVILLGYAIARFSAFLEGRSIERDFLYTLLVVGSLTLFYVLIVTGLYLAGAVSFLTLALTVVGTVAANSLFDGARLTLDRIFYQGRFRALRANLRALAEEAGASGGLHERLQAILDSMCRALHLTRGFIALRRENEYVIYATTNADALDSVFSNTTLDADEMLGLTLPARRGLHNMTLLVPLFAEDKQIGALVLGPPQGDPKYQEHDYELLEDLSDQMARVIQDAQAQRENADKINNLVAQYRERERALQLQVQQLTAERDAAPAPKAPGAPDDETLIPQVEDALRHINDYPYLGEHALSKLRVVERVMQQRADATPSSFVDRGKAVSQVVLAMLDELKPEGAPPKGNQVAPREWHLYLILYDSYVLDEPNREVMSKLYISEGTFNRTRRRALRALAKTLAEYETSVS
jgi:hypothetical protein